MPAVGGVSRRPLRGTEQGVQRYENRRFTCIYASIGRLEMTESGRLLQGYSLTPHDIERVIAILFHSTSSILYLRSTDLGFQCKGFTPINDRGHERCEDAIALKVTTMLRANECLSSEHLLFRCPPNPTQRGLGRNTPTNLQVTIQRQKNRRISRLGRLCQVIQMWADWFDMSCRDGEHSMATLPP